MRWKKRSRVDRVATKKKSSFKKENCCSSFIEDQIHCLEAPICCVNCTHTLVVGRLTKCRVQYNLLSLVFKPQFIHFSSEHRRRPLCLSCNHWVGVGPKHRNAFKSIFLHCAQIALSINILILENGVSRIGLIKIKIKIKTRPSGMNRDLCRSSRYKKTSKNATASAW